MALDHSSWKSRKEVADQAYREAASEQAIELYGQALEQPDVPWEVEREIVFARADSYRILGNYTAHAASLKDLAAKAAQCGDLAAQSRALAEVAWSSRLTGEQEQRTAELTIFTSVGEAMSRQLDVDAIIRIVGDEVREIFHSECVAIRLYNPQSDQITNPYVYDKGYIQQAPWPFGRQGLTCTIIGTRQPIVFGTYQQVLQSGAIPLPDTAGEEGHTQSYLGVPIIFGEKVIGTIDVQSYQQNAYGESQLRLLSTMASAMGVALENARLFAETQRLLVESRQRAAELAMINSVGQAMSRQLEASAIIKIVGDQIREIFQTETTIIMLYDPDRRLIIPSYWFDRGYTDPLPAPIPFGLGLTSIVIRTRQPLLISTIEEQEQMGAIKISRTAEDNVFTESYLGVPIIIGERVIGVVAVQSYQQYAYADSHVRLLSTLASSMGVALENARLFGETQRRIRELSALTEIGQALSSTLHVNELLQVIYEQTSRVLYAENMYIALYDEAADEIVFAFSRNPAEVKTGTRRSAKIGMTGHIIHTHQAIFLRGNAEEFERQTGIDIIGVPSAAWLGVPMSLGNRAGVQPALMDPERVRAGVQPALTDPEQVRAGVQPALTDPERVRVLGVIAVQHYSDPNAYDDIHKMLLEAIASQAAVALENARLFEETQRLLDETQRRMGELNMLSEISRALSSTLRVDELLELIYEQTSRVLYAENMYIALYDPAAEEVEFVLSRNPDEVKPGTRASAQEGLTGYVIRSHTALFIHGNAEAIKNDLGVEVAGQPMTAWLGVPMMLGERVLGVIVVQHDTDPNAYDETHLMLLEAIAGQAAVALENARLYVDAARRANQMAILAEAGREISASHDLHAIMERITRQAHEVCRARTTVLRLADTDGQSYRTSVALGQYAEQFRSDVIYPGKGITGAIILSGAAEIIPDPSLDPRASHVQGTPEKEEKPETLMIAPLVVRGQTEGVLTLYRWASEGQFTAVDLDFLSGLARQAAVAIENVRLLESVEDSRHRMADIIDFTPDPVLVIDREGKIIAWNRAMEDLTGVRAAKMLGKGNYEYALPFYGERRPILIDLVTMPQEELEQNYTNIHMEGPVLVGEAYMPQLRGGGVYLLGTASALHDAQGQVVGAIEVIRDMTERKRAEEALKRSEQLYRSVIDNSIDVFYRADMQGNLILASPSWAELLRYDSMDEVIGLNVARDFYANPADRDRFLAIIMKDGVIKDYEAILKRKDGTTVTVLSNSHLFYDENGKPAGVEGFLRDFTERKRMEEELRKNAEALREAKEAAEAATQAKSAFLATMSHEIRTPMNAIIGMSGLLLNTELTGQQREFAEIIRASGDALLTIINDILDFSKIEAGKLELEYTAFDLRDCLESAVDLLAASAAEKKLDLAVEIGRDVPPAISSDITRLRQILINLLNNAIKFTEKGEIVVTVNSELGTKSAASTVNGEENIDNRSLLTVHRSLLTLHFSVRDTGIGIPADRLDRLFQSFSQVDSSTSRRYGGTGLGLAISKRLAEMMGGTMWVESQVGVGSTFHFTIQTEPAQIEPRTSFHGEQPRLAGRRLLVVDDNPTNRRIVILQTKDWGMLARETGSPEEALAWIRQGDPFDLAILDMHMPQMDGITLGREIRKLRDAKALPLVMLSSLVGRESGIEQVDWAACLSKPIKQSQLFNILAGIFDAETGKSSAETRRHGDTGRSDAGTRGRGDTEKEVPVSPLPRVPASPPQVDADMAKRHPLAILLAEDNVFNQKLAVHLLAQMGYRADLAANGLEAVQSVARQRYDVILMDVQMPEMDGLEAARRICARWPRAQRPYIIAMTANAMQGDREMCLASGMDDYISKPIRIAELAAALNRVPTERLEDSSQPSAFSS